MTDEVKPKKRGRPKGVKDSPDVVRPPREQTEAQKANQFKPGNKANADGWSMRKETRAYRKALSSLLLSEQGIDALLQMYTATAANGDIKSFMEIQRFMAEYAFGKPKDMLETEENVAQLSQGSVFQQPLFGFVKETLDEAQDSDAEYL